MSDNRILWRIYDSSGKLLNLIGTVVAITEQEAMERAFEGKWHKVYSGDGTLPLDARAIC